ncbi:MAG: hypothetical protein ACSHYC_13275 [Alphaproteobacteria bacterium]
MTDKLIRKNGMMIARVIACMAPLVLAPVSTPFSLFAVSHIIFE